MKRISALILPLAIAASPAFSETEVYVAGLVSMTNVDLGIDASTLTTVDEDGTSFEGIIGVKLNDNFSVEGHYANLGEASVSIAPGGTITADGSTITNTTGATLGVAAEAKSLGAGLVMHGSGDEVVPFAKVGWHSWDLDVPVSLNGINLATLSEDGNDVFYGAGVMWKLTDGFALRGEYMNYHFEDEDVGKIGLGLVLNF